MASTDKFLVIVGPTASGKSALALELAQLLSGEIICADSRTVYKGLDIGTAKPSRREREIVPHHLLDIVEPDRYFTVADFKLLANEAIRAIQSRGKLPIMVGGSGLYVDAVLYNYEFAGPDAPRDAANPRHISREVPRKRGDLRKNTLVIGLEMPREILKQRIAERIDKMIEQGFLEEVKRVQADYPGSKALLAPGYKAFSEHIDGRLSLEDAKALFIKNDMALAKRQMTWFRRNKSIHWLNDPSTYVEETLGLLNKLQ